MEFKEEQKFTQWWLWLILIGIGLIPIWGVSFGDKVIPGTGIIVTAIFIFGLIILFLFIRLETKIDQDGILMRFFPFVRKNVRWSDIKNAEVVNYGFVGGWGIRLGTKYGTVYNIRGNMGLAIELKNGERFLIGTQKEKELAKLVEKYL